MIGKTLLGSASQQRGTDQEDEEIQHLLDTFGPMLVAQSMNKRSKFFGAVIVVADPDGQFTMTAKDLEVQEADLEVQVMPAAHSHQRKPCFRTSLHDQIRMWGFAVILQFYKKNL